MIWLLPGMDATGLLWGPLLEALGERKVRAFAYPADVVTYARVLEHVGPPDDGTVLVSESFSTPAAVAIARAHPERVRALVIVAGFLRGPWVPPAAVLRPLLGIRPPALALRALMVGWEAPDELVALVQRAVGSVPAWTLAARLREAARTDARAAFSALRMPVLWVRATRDRLITARATREARASLAALDVRVVDGPHLLAQARPRELAELITQAERAPRP
ncbi:MAG: alpha/beta fold hydrolase [Planctomycetes bacterium]|nr:alpha/beta fold hydrolase [Planctomycetota bacterium]